MCEIPLHFDQLACHADGLFQSHADALAHASDGTTYFAEPLTQKLTIRQLLSRLDLNHAPSHIQSNGIHGLIASNSSSPNTHPNISASEDTHRQDIVVTSSREICYLQSQNGNLYRPCDPASPRSEMEALKDDVPMDIPWATEALG